MATKRQIKIVENFIKNETKKIMKEETYADAAKRVGLKGSLDNEIIGYMEDLFSAIKNIEQYDLARSFPNNKVATKQMQQAFNLIKSTTFGQLFK